MWISLKLFLEDVFKRNLTELLGRRHILIDCLKSLFARLPKRAIANLMHCAPRKQIPRISCYTKLLIVVQDLVSVRTALVIHWKKNCNPFEWLRAIRSRKIAIRSNGSGYPFEKNCHPFERLGLSFGKNCHPPFERLGLSVGKNFYPFERLVTVPNHFHGTRLRRTCQKDVDLNDLRNSSKLCLPSPHDHEFSRHIFCWIAFFAFITSIIVTSFIQE